MPSVKFPLVSLMIALSPLTIANAATPQSASVIDSQRSATKSRDIGGFTLGMHIRDVAKISPLEALGNDNFQTIRGGITYDFQVTPKGRVYRITSTQPLGRFSVDNVFLRTLAAKLTSKYGQPTSSGLETFGWSLIEPVKRINGSTLPFETMWASAYVQKSGADVSVEMKMIDFRILWRDVVELNRTPLNQAANAIAF